MTASKKQAITEQRSDSPLNDEIVLEYLKNNNDFLQRNPEMLDYLHISHASGSAVSLVEKQASVLRERNTQLRQQLKTLTNNAKANDALFEQTRALVLKLVAADSLASLYRIFTTSMTTDFQIEYASMILYDNSSDTMAWRSESQDTVKRQIGALFKGHKAVCGTLRQAELNFLFPEGSGMGSAALAPLVGSQPLGLIAVGSTDANRYNGKMDTLFLAHVADVLVTLMARLPNAQS